MAKAEQLVLNLPQLLVYLCFHRFLTDSVFQRIHIFGLKLEQASFEPFFSLQLLHFLPLLVRLLS